MVEMKHTPEQERASWQYRAIALTRGNSTMLGTLILAVLGRSAKHPPAMGQNAIITTDGMIVTQVLTRAGILHKAVPIGRVSEVVDELRRLCDTAKLDDAERQALFASVRAWIVKDYRATSDPEEWESRGKTK